MSIPLHQYFIFVSIVTMIVVTPGPNLALLLTNSPSNTKLTGFGMVFGFAAAIVSHATLALVGVGAVIAASAILFTVMKLLGAAYLIWLGIKSLLSLRGLDASVINPSRVPMSLTAPKAFVRGYLSNFLNPKPAIFYVAVFPQFLEGHQQDLANGAALALTHALIAVGFYGVVVLLVGSVTGFLNRPHIARRIKTISGAAFILLGGRLLLAKSPA
ncbi:MULTISPECIES: LysE family translocator [unclassified Phyllobacterium]|jgi:threonine/homoserine/homoserine lactone efflux protein|uniref:LysE family translocator n=1 Tax=unclassified Phyllobacterium TaxID=2638441 RepID=UPI003012EF72